MTQSRPLNDKVAIVTGARRGIGLAEADALAAAGAKVVACDLAYDELVAACAGISSRGDECLPLKCDVRDPAQIREVVDQTISTYGRIDILVNNAQGALDGVPWEDIDDALLDTSLGSGPIASLRFMQACFPHMKAQEWGRIINTASAASRGGAPNLGHYAMAKGAVAGLTYAAATDWSKFGITANVIYPMIATDPLKEWMAQSPDNKALVESHIPVGFLGEAERDLAPLVVFLASDGARYLTGHPFFVDGGAGNAPR